MVPVAKRLEMISEQIMNTGETILHRLQFIPKSLSNKSIPGGYFICLLLLTYSFI